MIAYKKLVFFLPVDYEEGNTCYCTYSMEITREADSKKMAETSYETASDVLNTCIKLRGTDNFKKSMEDVIKDIRKICNADYCCIMTSDFLTSKFSILCEDGGENKSFNYSKNWATDDFFKMALSWEDTISGSNCLILKNKTDMEVLKERNPAWYESLQEAKVNSIALFPLKFGYELLGYIWATDFDTENVVRIKETLELTSFFLGSEIANYQLFDRLKFVSTMDMLTGVFNRNEMNDRVNQLSVDNTPNKKNIGVIFADLNGLKRVNDSEGHDAGDALIKDASAMLREVFPKCEIFRAGGDEFMILLRDVNEDEIKLLMEKLKSRAEKHEKVSFALGYSIQDDCNEIRRAMREADSRMYEDKNKYYEKFPELKR
ncbi:MAG: GGDEF domain-containing protein [Treponema sp.]|nr:GGDEF domain-containing protein [Treponema sp.]